MSIWLKKHSYEIFGKKRQHNVWQPSKEQVNSASKLQPKTNIEYVFHNLVKIYYTIPKLHQESVAEIL